MRGGAGWLRAQGLRGCGAGEGLTARQGQAWEPQAWPAALSRVWVFLHTLPIPRSDLCPEPDVLSDLTTELVSWTCDMASQPGFRDRKGSSRHLGSQPEVLPASC